MSFKNRTKNMYATALQEILQTQTFEKVQVKDICEKCGTRRQTFYYHFRDKYDLVAWIFNQDYTAVFCTHNYEFSEERLIEILDIIKAKKSFYKKTLNEHSQNSIQKYIQDFDVKIGEKVVKSAYSLEHVTEEQLYAIKYHSYGCIGLLIEWLANDLPLTTQQFAHYQYETMPDFLRNAYIKYHSKH
ncbi:MAG: TetR/AcrR family transcriptional regulator C-terminal domain-containing protein [Clostridium sp.]|nr:TetR/AcrR family transcriptional regulator C-terminal domain-containing protein [Clostridium sp.]